MAVTASLHPPPMDATLTVARAAGVLGVHPNTVRAWSDAGRIRYYRINPRGDRRYRIGDLQRFLAGAAEGPAEGVDLPTVHALRRRLDPGAFALPNRATRPSDPGVGPDSRTGTGSRAGTGVPAGTGSRAVPDAADAQDVTTALTVMSGLGRVAASVVGLSIDPDALLGSATRTIREGAGLRHVSVWRREGENLIPVGFSGPSGARPHPSPSNGLLSAALAHPGELLTRDAPVGASGSAGTESACAIPGGHEPWGVLLAVADEPPNGSAARRETLIAAAAALGTIVHAADVAGEVDRRVHRAEALSRVAGDIGSRLDLDVLLARLIDHAMTLFGGDRAAVFLYQPDGTRRAAASRGLSSTYLLARGAVSPRALSSLAISSRRPVFAVAYRDDPRASEARAAIVQEGYDTLCVAPLLDVDDGAGIGSLNVYHNEPHHWTSEELETMAAFATQASVAIRSARTYAQLSTWAAQLQSIQQLGARLNRLSDVGAIGSTIATELREIIDYHNARVYRIDGDDLIPVAMKGQVGEYIDETPEQLRVRVGYGITGWVAEHRLAQNLPNAAADPRANTIPGTEADLDESMLLAPMLFEDEVLGVLVLSKLGLHQFQDDDLRLLVIYASFAAQAMAHADATQRLRRQVQSQRDLLQLTEAILTTLDTASVLESVAARLGGLVGWDSLAIELVDPDTGILTPVVAKGSEAAEYLEPWLPGETGLATWVVAHNEAVLLEDEHDDPRVRHSSAGPVHGGLICVPLRGRSGAIGILTLERVGLGRRFSDEEFELVKLFAAQVSIAVQNAQAHGAVARQAETDDLTGLRNHRSFRAALSAAVDVGHPFSLLMVDLDHFKLVNDTFGHESGNDFLRGVARAIVGASRDSDAAFRYGGDEFVVLLAGADAEHVGPVADRIRCAIAEITNSSPELLQAGIRVDASAGVAAYPTDGASADSILLAADRACFVAKRSGGGRVAGANEGETVAGEFTLQVPTPIDAG